MIKIQFFTFLFIEYEFHLRKKNRKHIFLLESISFIYSHPYIHIHILISNFGGSLLILLTVGKD